MENLISKIVSLYACENITIDCFDSCVVINTGQNKITINNKSSQQKLIKKRKTHKEFLTTSLHRSESEVSDKKIVVVEFDNDRKLFREITTGLW